MAMPNTKAFSRVPLPGGTPLNGYR
ncbi:hypothetical protein SAMN05660880_04105, partial [Luteibacter sp. 22Crub2.1]